MHETYTGRKTKTISKSETITAGGICVLDGHPKASIKEANAITKSWMRRGAIQQVIFQSADCMGVTVRSMHASGALGSGVWSGTVRTWEVPMRGLCPPFPAVADPTQSESHTWRERIAFVEHSPYALGARHRFLRTSQAPWMLCRNPPPGPEAPT